MATAGGLVIAGIGSVVGFQMTDSLDRYIATFSTTASPAPALPAGFTGTLAHYNASAVAAKPGIGRVLGGLGMMLLGFGGGALAPWAGLKMFMYGWGLGASAHLGGALLNGYVLEPLFMTNGQPSATGARLFSAENAANAVIHPATTTSSSTTTTTTTGTTQGLGAPPGLYSQRGTPLAALAAPRHTVQSAQARIPAALASRRGGRLGDVTLDLSSSPLETARQNPPITPPPAPPISPPAPPTNQYTPPVMPPPAPPVYTPPSQQYTPPQNCAPCAPQPGPPQGATPNCGCAQAGSCGQCGAPPEDLVSNYRHPLFRTMTQHSSNVRALRRAA